MANKKISVKCLALIKEFEGCRLTAYRDEVGVWTIGYGITNADRSITKTTIKKGLRITQATAEEWLEKALNKKYLPIVMKYDTRYGWNQNELDALVSFAYNVGSIDQLTANGSRSKAKITDKMLEYNKAGGKVYRGLTRRREAERKLFLKPMEGKEVDDIKKKGCFSKNKNADNISEYLHNRGYGAGEHNLRLIAAENAVNKEVRDALFELAEKGNLRKPDGLNKLDK